MSLMQQAVLESRLKDVRFGNTIRIHLPDDTHHKIIQLKRTTGRTYHDIIKIIISVYIHQPDHFSDLPIRTLSKVINVRLSRTESALFLDEAWYRGLSRNHFLGMVVTQFMDLVSIEEITDVLNRQADRVLRLTGGLNAGKRNQEGSTQVSELLHAVEG